MAVAVVRSDYIPEDPRLEEIKERVRKLKLEQIQDEIRKLEIEKQDLDLEKELKLKEVQLKINNLPRGFQAAHPVISKIASNLGTGGYNLGKGIVKGAAQVGKYLVDNQRAEELHQAQLAKLRPKIVQTPSGPEYVPYFDRIAKSNPTSSPTVIDRLVKQDVAKAVKRVKAKGQGKEQRYVPYLDKLAEG